MTFAFAAKAIVLAHGAVPSAEFWFELLFILAAVGFVAAIVWRGFAKRKPWWWWLALTTIASITFFVVSTYARELRDLLILPLLDWLGL